MRDTEEMSSDFEFTMLTVNHQSDDHGAIDLNVAVAGNEGDPLIVFVHGWPETWHTWDGQIRHFAGLGYRVAALDVRGYGASSRPGPVEAYRLRELSGDLVAVINELSPIEPAIVVGHDWGAPIVYQAARLFPDRVRAVAGMSVPYLPVSPGDPMDLWDAVYAGRFFYMKYFQTPGVVESAFEADLGAALRKIYFAASGAAPSGLWASEQPEDAAMLDFLVDPDPAPAWMSPERVATVVDANGGGPLHGWFNRYRAQKFDGADLAEAAPANLAQPACFIAGASDIVRDFVAGIDLFAGAEAAYDDARGLTIIEGSGHWVQQEKPDETNAALEAFVSGL